MKRKNSGYIKERGQSLSANLIMRFPQLYLFLLKSIYRLKHKKNKSKRTANIAMLHSGRVGSTVTAALLNADPMLHWDGEIFFTHRSVIQKTKASPITEFLKRKIFIYAQPLYGFELTDRQIYRSGKTIKKVIAELKDIGFNYFIVLKRENFLRQYISLKRIEQFKIGHIKKDLKLAQKININTKNPGFRHYKGDLIGSFNALENFYFQLKEELVESETLFLSYEQDILENPNIGYEKICNFCGIKMIKQDIPFKRTNPFKLNEIIENYSETEAFLKGSKYEHFLYE